MIKISLVFPTKLHYIRHIWNNCYCHFIERSSTCPTDEKYLNIGDKKCHKYYQQNYFIEKNYVFLQIYKYVDKKYKMG